MSEQPMQRYEVATDTDYNGSNGYGYMKSQTDGRYVTYSDHVAALARQPQPPAAESLSPICNICGMLLVDGGCPQCNDASSSLARQSLAGDTEAAIRADERQDVARRIIECPIVIHKAGEYLLNRDVVLDAIKANGSRYDGHTLPFESVEPSVAPNSNPLTADIGLRNINEIHRRIDVLKTRVHMDTPKRFTAGLRLLADDIASLKLEPTRGFVPSHPPVSSDAEVAE